MSQPRSLITEFVLDSAQKMKKGQYDLALASLWPALDGTAKKEYPNLRSKKRCMKFVRDNLPLISLCAYGCEIQGGLNLGFKHPDIKTGPNGCAPLEEILYTAIRCVITHEGGFPANVRFVPKPQIRVHSDSIEIGQQLICGLLVAIACSPTNAHLTFDPNLSLNLPCDRIPLVELQQLGKGAIERIKKGYAKSIPYHSPK